MQATHLSQPDESGEKFGRRIPELALLAYVAHRCKNHSMKRAAQQTLKELYGMRLSFRRSVGSQRPSTAKQSPNPKTTGGRQ